jgi:hypothetical protein
MVPHRYYGSPRYKRGIKTPRLNLGIMTAKVGCKCDWREVGRPWIWSRVSISATFAILPQPRHLVRRNPKHPKKPTQFFVILPADMSVPSCPTQCDGRNLADPNQRPVDGVELKKDSGTSTSWCSLAYRQGHLRQANLREHRHKRPHRSGGVACAARDPGPTGTSLW